MRSIRLLLLCAGLLLVGCWSRSNPPPPSQIHLEALARGYSAYTSAHGGKGPGGEAEFRTYLAALPAPQAKSLGLDTSALDAVFQSPRDGKPYIVVYGFDPTKAGPGEPIVAAEQVGQQGKRYVAYISGKVVELDDVAVREALPQ